MYTGEVRVDAVTQVGPEMVELTLETPPGFDANPGQFVLVRTTIDGERVGRHYTLSSPGVDETFEITVEADDRGTVSAWLAGLTPGDVIWMEGPLGRVHYEGEDPIVLVAGGPGIGGALGIAERAHADGGTVVLVYRDDGMAHEDRVAALAADGATVFYVRDRLAPAVGAVVDRGQLFVIGYREFIDEALDAVAAAGGKPREAKVENFGPR